MEAYEKTIISQYGGSITLLQLLENFNDYIDPSVDLDMFYSYIWDVNSAQGFGLDILGKIVVINRNLQIPAENYLGFDEGNDNLDYEPFGFGVLFKTEGSTQTYTLADDAYRVLILVKAFANISNLTAPNVNKLLRILFAGRGNCYCTDDGGMQTTYHFDFDLQPFEVAILLNSGAVPRPSGVKLIIDY